MSMRPSGQFQTCFFFTRKFHTHKKYKTHISEQKQKRQHFYAHKKHLRGRESLVWCFVLFTLFTLFTLFMLFMLFTLFMLVFCFLCFFLLFVLFVLFVCVNSSCKKKKKKKVVQNCLGDRMEITTKDVFQLLQFITKCVITLLHLTILVYWVIRIRNFVFK